MRNTLIALAAALLVLAASGCDVLSKNISTSGPQRYKAEVAAVLQDAKEQLDNEGKIHPTTRKKLDGIVTRYEKDMAPMTSMRELKEAQVSLDKMESEPNNAFQYKDSAMLNFAEALKALETEVRSDAG
jgi:hypothetical protein